MRFATMHGYSRVSFDAQAHPTAMNTQHSDDHVVIDKEALISFSA
jgi:hypothetical protein